MKKILQFFGIVLLMILIAVAGYRVNRTLQETAGKEVAAKKCVLIDAGHGGVDPGKVGVNDVLEKDLNLVIGNQVAKNLRKRKVEVIQTRTTDETMAEDIIENKKIVDLKRRVDLMNESSPNLVVSIHQNSYTSEEVHGAQVFYHGQSTEGERAADIMQKALLSVDTENMRKPKANETYYILSKTKVPTIIVECGFLSNPLEAEKLLEKKYQKKMATAITDGIMEYLML